MIRATRPPLLLLALLALPLLGCAQLLRNVPGGAIIGDRLDDNARVVGQNLVGMVASGEITQTAAFDMEQEHYLGKTVAASVFARVGGQALVDGLNAALGTPPVGHAEPRPADGTLRVLPCRQRGGRPYHHARDVRRRPPAVAATGGHDL